MGSGMPGRTDISAWIISGEKLGIKHGKTLHDLPNPEGAPGRALLMEVNVKIVPNGSTKRSLVIFADKSKPVIVIHKNTVVTTPTPRAHQWMNQNGRLK
jgi:hypothetical protein